MEAIARIDKWLWAVRIFRTRSMAAEACRQGKVTISDIPVKPSREVKPGDIVIIRINPQFSRTVRVIALLPNRVGAGLVGGFAEDLTPPEEFEKLRILHELNWERRDRGIGRPTKKQRRDIDRLKKREE